MFRFFMVSIAILFVADSTGSGEYAPIPALTLHGAFLAAKEAAPIFRVAKYRIDSASAQKSVARGQLLPQVSLFGEWSDNKLKYEGALGSLYGEENYPGERYGYQLRQSLVNMAGWRELERQDALLNRSENEFAQAEIDLLRSVTEAYIRVLVASDTVRQSRAESDALKKQLQETEALYERSLVPVTQLLETQTRNASVMADFIEAEGEVAIAREQLAELIGFREFSLMPLGREVVLGPRPRSIAEAAQLAAENSPAIAAAEDGASAAKAAVEREKGSWWPSIDLVFSQQHSDVGFDNLSSPPRTSDMISIAVSYPLIQGGSGSARIRGAWADFYGAQQELEGVKRAVETQARTAWLQFETADKRVNAAQRALDSAKVNVDASRQSVNAGTARVTDILLALAQRTRAQRNHSYAQFQRISAWLALALVSGSDVDATASELSDALLATTPLSASALMP